MTSNCSKLAKQHKTKVAVLKSIALLDLLIAGVQVRQFKDGRGFRKAIGAVLHPIGFACTLAGHGQSSQGEHFKTQIYVIPASSRGLVCECGRVAEMISDASNPV